MVQYYNQTMTLTIHRSYSNFSSFTCHNVDLNALGPTHENKAPLLGLFPDLTTSTKLIIKQSCPYIDPWSWKCWGKCRLGEGTSQMSPQPQSEIPRRAGMINVLDKQWSARIPTLSFKTVHLVQTTEISVFCSKHNMKRETGQHNFFLSSEK